MNPETTPETQSLNRDSSNKGSRSGFWLLLIKIGPKILALLTKVFKGGAVVKTAGAVASVGLYSYLLSWQMGIALVLFLLIHEYGHMWAMKKCGIKTKGMYLIPGLGAVAIAAERFKSGRNEAYIAVMGPLFGLFFLVPCVILYWVLSDPLYLAIASIMALINLFNLFPINPLDGGRMVKSILYSFRSSIGFFFTILTFFLATFLGWKFGLGLLVYIALIGLWETLESYGLVKHFVDLLASGARAAGAMVLYYVYDFALFSSWSISGIEWWEAFFAIALRAGAILFFGAVICAFAFDIYYSTVVRYGRNILLYPLSVVQALATGLISIFTIKPSELKTVEEHVPMTGKQQLLYAGAYLGTILLMLAFIAYAAIEPGAGLALEFLKE